MQKTERSNFDGRYENNFKQNIKKVVRSHQCLKFLNVFKEKFEFKIFILKWITKKRKKVSGTF